MQFWRLLTYSKCGYFSYILSFYFDFFWGRKWEGWGIYCFKVRSIGIKIPDCTYSWFGYEGFVLETTFNLKHSTCRRSAKILGVHIYIYILHTVYKHSASDADKSLHITHLLATSTLSLYCAYRELVTILALYSEHPQ